MTKRKYTFVVFDNGVPLMKDGKIRWFDSWERAKKACGGHMDRVVAAIREPFWKELKDRYESKPDD